MIASIFPISGQAQTPHATRDDSRNRLEKHGTCATTIVAPFGAAFIIDSRLTETLGDQIVSQHPGCKVLLARPSILLAGVGVEDTTGRAGHWNSLDEASNGLKKLPENPTKAQLDQWASAWGTTLENHYRQAREKPNAPAFPLSEMLLVTRVGNEFYFKRAGVEWDGVMFKITIAGQVLDETIPQVEFAGLCRKWVGHDDGDGHLIPPQDRTHGDDQRMRWYERRRAEAKTVDDLRSAALGLESVLTDMDERLEGKQAGIAPPYANAEWAAEDKGWTTHFNAECESKAGAFGGPKSSP